MAPDFRPMISACNAETIDASSVAEGGNFASSDVLDTAPSIELVRFSV
jgi:hypothetical protein